MKKAYVKHTYYNQVPVCCQTCRHYSEIDRNCHTSKKLCRDNGFALWEYETYEAEIIQIWDEKDEVKP